MITGRDILYISSIEWSFLWQGHQEIALRLAAAGNRVLYVENTGVRSPGLRDAGRVVQRLSRWAKAAAASGVREVAPNVYVSSPMVLPPFGSRARTALNRRVFLPLLVRSLKKLGMRDLVVWTYLPNDTTADLVGMLREEIDALVYYCVADFTQLTPHAERLAASEREIVTGSDAVFTNCSELARKFAPWNSNAHVFPFGVNLDAFPFEQNAPGVGAEESNGHRAAKSPAAALIESLPRPVVGYVGGMHRHVDFELIKEMAVRRPDWSWVCVGALQAALGDLAALPNVHLLGQQPHTELVNFIRGFDVCVVPYVDSVYTATVVPTKINEYLAVGKPVVSTALPPVREFNEEHGVLFTAEAEAGSFLRAIEDALAEPQDEETRLRRRRVAEQGDWGARFEAMCRVIEESRGGFESGTSEGNEEARERVAGGVATLR
ncbi:MAG TPA: glycosyltransferase [Pyrinomonadaceae bacterium]|nr:glycosyltransferase [Pyrinomonadaceae bacterium]